ncbi:MAG TPA: Fe-S oxidoreductase [Microbacteriaceae bacterium]|nr:Fe-S oxidoreductase [Microbacteriaceae bacterium]
MRIGTRWSRGSKPHPSVPKKLLEDIKAIEELHPQGENWTLTWLEGNPVCTLDDLCVLSVSPAGLPIYKLLGTEDSTNNIDGIDDFEDFDDDDSWLK